jgi:hypothetical protein
MNPPTLPYIAAYWLLFVELPEWYQPTAFNLQIDPIWAGTSLTASIAPKGD